MEHSASRSPPGSWPATSTRTGGGCGAAFPPPVAALAPKRAIYGDHRRAAGVDGVDDLGVVDAVQIDRVDAEVAVAELALDDDQRHAFAGHLDGMRVAQLVGREAPTHPGLAGDAAQFRAGGAGCPRPSAGRTGGDAEQRSDRQLDPGLEPWFELLPRPVVHAHLTAPAALAAPHQQRPAARIEIGLGERERLADPQASAPEHDDQPAQPVAVDAVTSVAHHADDLSIVGGSAG